MAWPPITPTTRAPDEEFVEGVGDGVVVDGAQHRGEDVAVGLGPLEPGVRERVRRPLVAPSASPSNSSSRRVEQRRGTGRRADPGTGGKTSAPSARTFARPSRLPSGSRGRRPPRCRCRAAPSYGPSGRPTGRGTRSAGALGHDVVELRQGLDLTVSTLGPRSGGATLFLSCQTHGLMLVPQQAAFAPSWRLARPLAAPPENPSTPQILRGPGGAGEVPPCPTRASGPAHLEHAPPFSASLEREGPRMPLLDGQTLPATVLGRG